MILFHLYSGGGNGGGAEGGRGRGRRGWEGVCRAGGGRAAKDLLSLTGVKAPTKIACVAIFKGPKIEKIKVTSLVTLKRWDGENCPCPQGVLLEGGSKRLPS